MFSLPIDFSKDFLWLDDTQFEGEKNVLVEKGALDKFILIDLKTNPNQLLDIVNGRGGKTIENSIKRGF